MPLELGDCAICLEPCEIEKGDTVQTRCQHRFHSRCLGTVLRTKMYDDRGREKPPVCPMCRAERPVSEDLPPAEVAQTNVYTVTLAVPAAAVAAVRSSGHGAVRVFFGALGAVDGTFANATDIGAGALLVVPLPPP